METLEQPLKQYFGFDTFLPGQRELIEQVVAGRDAFALMPTGAGKSLIYQLASLVMPGMTLVVSPLIALMQDQVERLHANGIAATFVNSALNSNERTAREQAALRGEIKLLYVAPERLLTPNFLELLDKIQTKQGIALLAVDEAHCVSEWGHDFRPEYRQLGSVRARFATTPLLALTATATERVRVDILTQLKLRQPHVHVASFNRPNLYYEVRPKGKGTYVELLRALRAQPEESTIIYCQSRKGVDDLSAQLSHDGVRVLPYHAGMSAEDRATNQRRFIRDDVPVLVATIAFGMGIAKPDVRTVIHYDIPRNLEGYYQESGRAGRDGLPAQCIVFFSYGDRAKIEYLIGQKDEQEARIARQQLQQVMAYSESSVCRRRVLLGYFGEHVTQENCGNCDVCLHPTAQEDRTVAAQKFLSCVGRVQERFGLRHIVDVLRGASTQKIRDFRHDQLSTYGIGKEYSADEWLHIGRALLHEGIVRETDDGYPVLRLTALSQAVLRGKHVVQIAAFAASIGTPAPSRAHDATIDLDTESAGLFQRLRELRKQFADEQSVPAYVIFPDATLRALAQQRPQSRATFGQIPGVGARKLEAYYTSFAAAIGDYCEAHHLETDCAPPPVTSLPRPEPAPKSLTHQLTLDLYRDGLSVVAIAEQRNLKPGTIIDHLLKCIEAGEELDPDRLIAPARREHIAAALQQFGSSPLTPAKEFLGDDYSFEELRLVRALRRVP